MAKKRTSFSLSNDALLILKKLSDKSGVSMASLLEIYIREAGKKEKIK